MKIWNIIYVYYVNYNNLLKKKVINQFINACPKFYNV